MVEYIDCNTFLSSSNTVTKHCCHDTRGNRLYCCHQTLGCKIKPILQHHCFVVIELLPRTMFHCNLIFCNENHVVSIFVIATFVATSGTQQATIVAFPFIVTRRFFVMPIADRYFDNILLMQYNYNTIINFNHIC
jgi:hypothetical protein